MADGWNAGLTPARAAALRGGFDADADACQRTRPVCPAPLFDDLIRLAGLAPGDRAVEIAPGTGQATLPLAERGLGVTAVEIGPSLAAWPGAACAVSRSSRWSPARSRTGPGRAEDFLRRVCRRLDQLGSPDLTATYVACLTVGSRT